MVLLPAAKVSSLSALVTGALNVAVTPVGSPLAVRLTSLLEPLAPVTVIFALMLEPTTSLSVPAELFTAKAGCGTVSTSAVVRTNGPDLPVTVTAYVPDTVVSAALKVSTLLLAVLVGLKVTVTPAGMPDAARLTLLLKPF
jgi:ABC-type nitrate/sulfonate/bicarbonate transport system substrate-binding protein